MIALVIDIGNTRIKWRVAQLDAPGVDGMPAWLSIEQAMPLTAVGDLEEAFRASATASLDTVDAAYVANVASDTAGRAVRDAVTAVWPATPVRPVRPTAASGNLVNAYRDPLQLGVDRWLAAVAAHGLFPDRPVLICSFGTATTIDLVESHRFVGGLILPGIEAMHSVLTSSTARLPASAGQVVDFGDRTEDAIASGVMAAQIGAVERTLRKARDRRVLEGDSSVPICIVAGGAAGRLATLFDGLDTPHCVIHDLVLRGLALVARDAVTSRVEPSIPAL